MPGRITDELRRITREQGGDAAPDPPSEPGEAASLRRRYGPLLVLIAVAALTGLGWVLVRQLMADSKLQDCVMSGRKNCVPLDVDGAAP